MDDDRRLERRPDPAAELAHRTRSRHRGLHAVVGGVPRRLHAEQHQVGDPLREHLPSGLVAGAAGDQVSQHPGQGPLGQPVEPVADRHLQDAGRRAQVVPDRASHNLGHPRVALEHRHRRGVAAGGLQPRIATDQGLDRVLGGVDLAQRGQHVGDVAEERTVRTEHEDAGSGELGAIGVQQVRRPVQSDRCLAGAGGALDRQRLVERGANQDVLVGLDRGDDVAHRAGARPLDLLLQDRPRPGCRPVGEKLVLIGGEPALLEPEPAPGPDPHQIAGPRPVEGQCHRRPPVHHQGVGTHLRLDVAAPDVAGLVPLGAQAHGVVDPSEEQRDGRVVGQRLAPPVQLLTQVLGRDVVAADHRPPVRRLGAHHGQGGSGGREVGALGGQDGILRHAFLQAGRTRRNARYVGWELVGANDPARRVHPTDGPRRGRAVERRQFTPI